MPVGHLFYAKGAAAERQMVIRGSGVELHAHELDPDLESAELLQQGAGQRSTAISFGIISCHGWVGVQRPVGG